MKTQGRKLLSLTLALCLTLGILPVSAGAAGGEVIINLEDTLTQTDDYDIDDTGSPAVVILENPDASYVITGKNADTAAYVIQVGTAAAPGTYTITLDAVTIEVGSVANGLLSGIDIVPGATADITLSGENFIDVSKNDNIGAAIHVPAGAAVILDGDAAVDKLTVTARLAAAVGGNDNRTGDGEDAGRITIQGGFYLFGSDVNPPSLGGSTSTYYDIGGGGGTAKGGDVEAISINGGTIYCGIIGGGGGVIGGDSGKIVITDGTIMAQSSHGAIGGGYGSSGDGATDLTIEGGTLDLYGYHHLYNYPAGNGYGYPGNSGVPIHVASGRAAILGGTVRAWAGRASPAAHVGAGAELFIGAGATVSLTGGVTSAEGGSTGYITDGPGAAIGGRESIEGGTFFGKVVIAAGADVTLTGGAGYANKDRTTFTGGGAAIGGTSRVETGMFSGDIAGSGIDAAAVIILPDDLAGLTLNGGPGFVNSGGTQQGGDGAKIGAGGRGGHILGGSYSDSVTVGQLAGAEAAFAAIPVADIAGGSYAAAQMVALSCATADVVIRYTLDGSDPKISDTAETYTGPLNISRTTTLKAFTYKGGMVSSNTLSAVYTMVTVPGAPVVTATAGNGSIAAAWTAPQNGGSAITGYKVSVDGGASWTAASGTSHTFTGLTNGTAYTVWVVAVNMAGDSAAGTASATPRGGGGSGSDSPAPAAPAKPETGENKLSTPSGSSPVVDKDGTTTLPGGGTITTQGGSEIEAPANTIIDKDGNVIIPPDAQAGATLPNGTAVILPGGSVIGGNGDITAGGSAQVELPDGTTMTLPQGSVIRDGTIKVGVGGATVNHGGIELRIEADVEIILDEATPLGYFVSVQNPFSDVSPDDWFYDSVLFAYTHGLFSGTGAGRFSPNATMTRGMFVTVLSRLEGVDLSGYTGSSFGDVPPGEWYSAPIEWAAENGIVSGTGTGFDPHGAVTREQMLVMLYNYMKVSGIPIPTGDGAAFADENAISPWAAEAAEALQGMGIITGKPGNVLDPQGIATRAEVATVFSRLVVKLK